MKNNSRVHTYEGDFCNKIYFLSLDSATLRHLKFAHFFKLLWYFGLSYGQTSAYECIICEKHVHNPEENC